MRAIFFDKFKEMMRNDSSLFFLTGDTGFHLVESIFEEFPHRSLNVGVAEQNMIGIASGLVNIGFVPVCYAITNFLIERCFEQIRNDICLHEYKVILVGTSTGYDNGPLGATHHKLDDIGDSQTALSKKIDNMQRSLTKKIDGMEKSIANLKLANNQKPNDKKNEPPKADPNKVYNVSIGDSFVKGPADAAVTIIEWSDFQ